MLARWRAILALLKKRRLAADGTSARARRTRFSATGIASRLLTAALIALACCKPTAAQQPLFEQEPFDRITLGATNDHAVLQVKPLDLPDRQLPDPLPRVGKLRIRLMDDPGKLFEVAWQAIEKVELFEQMVLAKAGELVKAKEFEGAYDYFKFLEEKHPELSGLDGAMEEFLFQEARALYLNKQYDSALALLRELYRRNRQRPKLGEVLGATTERLVEQYNAREDYGATRTLLSNLAIWFPKHPVIAKHEGELKRQAAALSAQARSAIDRGDLRQAAQLSDRLTSIWPQLPGARELAGSIHQKYPRVVVGVSLPATDSPRSLPWAHRRLNDWAARRSGRLVYRTLTEFVGPGGEGGRYICPVGELTIETLQRRITVQIEPDLRWSSGEATLTGYDVSRRLLAMADPQGTTYGTAGSGGRSAAGSGGRCAAWAELLQSVAVAGVYQVDVQLRLGHVRPDALLQTILVPYDGAARPSKGPAVGNGPYVIDSRTASLHQSSIINHQSLPQTYYLANGRYFASRPDQPKEIVERYYPRGSKAIRALKAGRIHVLDRVNPWSLDEVRREKDLVVEPYAVPLVHCLIPNMRKPLTAHRAFRRALVYGIHRQAILNQLLGGVKLPGCRVLGGPFPSRLTLDDPPSYARDPGIEPRIYEPRLAIALGEVSRKEVMMATRQPAAEMPRLVLAHQPEEFARLACASIQRQLKQIGIPIELRELAGGVPAQIPQDVDLLYAELAIWEPLVDAPRLLGEDGMAAGCSPYMSLALRQLRMAAQWQQVSTILHRIDRIAHEEVAIVPLWQLTEHFAYRRNLRGIGTRPVSLYQNVEQWEIAFQYPAE